MTMVTKESMILKLILIYFDTDDIRNISTYL